MALTIVEVIGRSQQGRTEPYICRCDDGEVYFVKGRSATRKGLINEWLCASLAQAFGLPIAPFVIATVPEELMDSDLSGWLKDLGVGEVFASRRVKATELTHAQVAQVPTQQRQAVLLFDWWIHNEDRCLTPYGGNVNLLWNPLESNAVDDDDNSDVGLVVIDHNLAFDETFSQTNFCKLHVFADDLSTLFSDCLLRESYKTRCATTLTQAWQAACDNLPSAWAYIDTEQTIPTEYPFAQIKAILNSAQDNSFWTLPT
ncbi:MAG: hypothetical protein QM533_12225 [Cytophagales bacterium]|nr:hypothetical protein [Cytophagales bacterium]